MAKRRGWWLRWLVALGAVLSAGLSLAENIDPDDDGSQFAHGENVGWVSAELDTDGDGTPDEGTVVSDFSVEGWMWGENIGWVSLSCQNTGSCGTVPYGVTNDGSGNLAGYGWAENTGWISFSCGNTLSCGIADYGVSIDGTNGEFTGYAWSENVGWISFSCTNTSTCGAVDYGVKTGWCQTTAEPPVGTPDLNVDSSESDTVLSWSVLTGASWYEVVRGSTDALRSTGAGFASATDVCLADNLTANSLVTSDSPSVDDAHWYLVRGVNCKGDGTYDSGGTGQVGPRDAGVAASGNDCP